MTASIPRNSDSTNLYNQNIQSMPENNLVSNPAGVRVFTASIPLSEGKIKKAHTNHIHYEQKSIRQTAINTRKWCNSLVSAPWKDTHEYFYASDIFAVESKEFQPFEENKNSPHFVSAIGKHLQTLNVNAMLQLFADGIRSVRSFFYLKYFSMKFQKGRYECHFNLWMRSVVLSVSEFHFSNRPLTSFFLICFDAEPLNQKEFGSIAFGFPPSLLKFN